MNQIKIAVLVGSLRVESLNRKLANALVKLASAGFDYRMVDISALPLYNQDDETNPSEAVRRFREALAEADGLLFVTPEYNRSIPGVLKNALDIGSRPYGHNVWAGKPAGIIGVSTGKIGTAAAQQHLRNILAYLDAPVMNQPEAYIQNNDALFTASGEIGAASREFLQTWINSFETWVGRLLPA